MKEVNGSEIAVNFDKVFISQEGSLQGAGDEMEEMRAI